MGNVAELTEAIRARDLSKVAALIDESPDILKESTEGGVSFLMLAAYTGSVEVVRLVGELGGIWTVVDAVAYGDVEILTAQLDANPASVSAYTHDGWTPLHLAAYFGHEPSVTALLSHHADVNAWSKNAEKNQPLHAGCAGHATEQIVAALIDAGADINIAAQGGYTPVHLAASHGNFGVANALVARGADAHARTDDGKTAIDLASEAGFAELARVLAHLPA